MKTGDDAGIPRATSRAGRRRFLLAGCGAAFSLGLRGTTTAQRPPRAWARSSRATCGEMYDRGLQYLAKTQTEQGDWQGGQQGPGITGMGLMVFLASGEDPNFGPYSNNVRKALRSIINSQDAQTGIMGNAMYHHGFAMLGLAEAYGAVDERNLWPSGKGPRSIGQALELAVRAAITSQKKNPNGAWRYSPDAQRRRYLGQRRGLRRPARRPQRRHRGPRRVDQQGHRLLHLDDLGRRRSRRTPAAWAGSANRWPAAPSPCLVYAVARRKDLKQYRATLDYLKQRLEQTAMSYPEYARYYEAQALFQGDIVAWEKWNKLLIRQLKQMQHADGSIPGQFGNDVGTAMSLLALALNYRFLPIYER